MDHDLGYSNLKDFALAPYEGVKVTRCCPVCYQPLNEMMLDQRDERGIHISTIYQLRCKPCDRRTHWGSQRGINAAIEEWQA